MFLLLVFFILLREGEAAAACRLAAKASEAALEQHNLLREKVASRQLDKAIYGNLPGSKSLFKLKYDCTNEGLALATIGNKCKHSSIYMDKVGRGENFITYRLKTNPKPEQLAELFEYAVEDWSLTVENPLSADVVYTDTTMEPFANMIYNKTLKIGCAYLFCKDQGKVALACVYEKRPIEGEPLYWADSKNDKGCTKDAPCKKLIKGAVCSSNNGKVGPLCLQEPPPATEAPEITTEEPETPTDDPETPTDDPETPTDDPETPTDDPETPTDEPETPTDDPETPTDDPETPTDDPETPTDDPETTTDGEQILN
ncbi:unnamed protein product [Cylicocyclus nassatus]|uniref:SCP domain-containing protein n=1 Tax=Cylicocyclus nassatus TaxID=53992 RepID=A0AA36M423_CYLNA|nr:unnamed protein product [Cylicocyclus nassatus]